MNESVWSKIKSRIKSPVVIGEIIVAAFALVTAVTGTDYGAVANTVVAVVTALAAVFAAINNPADKNSL